MRKIFCVPVVVLLWAALASAQYGGDKGDSSSQNPNPSFNSVTIGTMNPDLVTSCESKGASPSATASVNATSIQAALNATGAVTLMTPGTFQINAALVIPSYTSFRLGENTSIQLASGSTGNMLVNSAYFPQRTVADAAISASGQTLTSNAANFVNATYPAGDIGRPFSLAGAGINGASAAVLYGTITAVTNSTTATVSIAASYTVSSASLSLFNRDSNIEVMGGTWARGNASGLGTGLHTLLFRRVDGLSIHDIIMTSSAGKYSIAPGDVTMVHAYNLTGNVASALIQFDGPVAGALVENVTGVTGMTRLPGLPWIMLHTLMYTVM